MTRLDTRALILISAAVVINIVAGQIVLFLKLPVYLDSIGTVLVAILAGPLAGGLAGALTNVIWGITISPVVLAFIPVAALTGVVAGYLARIGGFRNWQLAILAGAVIAVPTTIVAAPIIVYVFGGVTGGGPDFAAAYMLAVGSTLMKSVAWTNLATNLLDKCLTTLVAFVVANRLPLRLSTSFRFFTYSKAH